MEKLCVLQGLLLIIINSSYAAANSCIRGQPDAIHRSLPLKHTSSFLTPNILSPEGHQLIFTGIQFSCYGYVTNWTGVAALDHRYILLNHHLYLQVWRPLGDGIYRHIGSDYLFFNELELRAGTIVAQDQNNNLSYFYFSEKSKEGKQIPLYFQPGDVVGCFIPAHYKTTHPSLSLLYGDDISNTMVDSNMMVSQATSPNSCEVVDCEDSVDWILGVAPQINIGYVALEEEEYRSIAVQQNCTPADFPSCCTFSKQAREKIGVLKTCLKTLFDDDTCLPAIQSTSHLKPDTLTTTGYQVIFPGIRFGCHGYIKSWSALTVLDIRYVQPYTLNHHIFFQVWRPLTGNNYYLVGSEELKFEASELILVHQLQNSNNAYFAFTKKSGRIANKKSPSRIQFEPGDVIGSFIPARFGTLTLPLSFVYSNVPVNRGGSWMVTNKTEEQVCEVNVCATDNTVDSEVIPWISIQTVAMDPSNAVSTLPTCNISSPSSCHSSTATLSSKFASLLTTSTPCQNSCQKGNQYMGGLYGIVPILTIAIFFFFATISLVACSFVFCFLKRMRGRSRQTPTGQPMAAHPASNARLSAASESRRGGSTTKDSFIHKEHSKASDVQSVTTVVSLNPANARRNRSSIDTHSTNLSDLLEFHSYSSRYLTEVDPPIISHV